MQKLLTVYLFTGIWLSTSLLSQADTVKLKNGDSITGEVLTLSNGKLKFRTAAMGDVAIQADSIVSIESQTNMKINLKNGQDKIGKLADGKLVVKDGAPIENIDPTKIESIYTLETLKQEFSGEILFGGSSEGGNTDIQSYFLLAEARLSELLLGGNKDPIVVKGQFNIDKESGDLKSKNGLFQIRYDNMFWRNTSYFFLQRTSFDENRKLDLRTEEQLGLAQSLLKKSNWSLDADLGLNRIDSFFENSPSESNFSPVLGGHFKWNIYKSLNFTHDTSYRPTFEKISDYLLTLDSSISSNLSRDWKVKLLHQVFYDSQPVAGTRRTDRRIILTVGYSF